jgi:hypothetical protein
MTREAQAPAALLVYAAEATRQMAARLLAKGDAGPHCIEERATIMTR